MKAGERFDGVEVHGARGFLFNRFLPPITDGRKTATGAILGAG